MLEKLLEKYPDGPASDPLAKAKSLISQKRYDEAETELMFSDAPGADQLLKRLKLVQSQGQMKPPAPATARASRGRSLAISAVLAILTVVIVIAGVLLFNARQVDERPAKIEDALMSACFYVAVRATNITSANLSDDAIVRACTGEVGYVMATYPIAMSKCYDRAGDDDAEEWIICMGEENARFSMQYFIKEIN